MTLCMATVTFQKVRALNAFCINRCHCEEPEATRQSGLEIAAVA